MPPTNDLNVSTEELARLADEAMTLAKSHWESVERRPAYPNSTARMTTELFTRSWTETGRGGEVFSDFAAIAEHSRPYGGKFLAYVQGNGEPVGALGELLAAALNQNVTSWRSAPAAVAIEHAVVGWLADAVGCTGFSGSLCGGGSSANVMALAMAREAMVPANEAGARPGIVYASEQVHMSIPKAVSFLGLGRRNLRLVPSDTAFRMRVDALEAAIAADRSAGHVPIAIVATAGTVVAGAIDPLRDLATIAEREGLWLHVDGAYGALAALAVPEKYDGLDRADSVSLDPHKWLYQSVDCGALLHRHRDIARLAFAQTDDVVRVLNDEPDERFAFFEESMELSRRFRALKLWLSLQYHGRAAFRSAIARDLEHATQLADLVRSCPELELLAPVSLSAVCFRHRSCNNEALLKRLTARGRFLLSNATIGGRFALRACFVNYRTTGDDVRAIVPEVLAAASDLQA